MPEHGLHAAAERAVAVGVSTRHVPGRGNGKALTPGWIAQAARADVARRLRRAADENGGEGWLAVRLHVDVARTFALIGGARPTEAESLRIAAVLAAESR